MSYYVGFTSRYAKDVAEEAYSIVNCVSASGLMEIEALKFIGDQSYGLSINGRIEYQSHDLHAVAKLYKTFQKN